jgi:hypothetical protein
MPTVTMVRGAAAATPVAVAVPSTLDVAARLGLVADCEQPVRGRPAGRAPRDHELGGSASPEASDRPD